KLDPDVLTFGVAEALETAAECIGERMRRRCRHQHADARHFSGLLGERSTRSDEQTGRQDTPRSENAPTHPRDEGSPVHHGMIPWARVRIDCGSVSPSALAGVRLRPSSSLVGCATGRGAALAPLRILPTSLATSRYMSGNRGPYDIRPPASTHP